MHAHCGHFGQPHCTPAIDCRLVSSVCLASSNRHSAYSFDRSNASSRRGRDADDGTASTSGRRPAADEGQRRSNYREQPQHARNRQSYSSNRNSSAGGISEGFEVVSTSQSRPVTYPAIEDADDAVDPLDGSTIWRELSGFDEAEEEEEEEDEEAEGEEDDEGEGGDLGDDDSELMQAVNNVDGLALAAAIEAETIEQQVLRERFTGKQPLTRYMGPLKTAFTKGRGRGLLTAAAVAPGELLMVAVPYLGPVLFCDRQGETPENEELAQHLLRQARLGPKQHAILESLASDAAMDQAATSTASPAGQQAHMRLPSLTDFQEAADEAAALGSPIQMSAERIESIVNVNCLGEEFQDLAATALAGVGPSRGHLGLWPEPALLNHSCAPSATTYTIGDRLVVVATEEHREGAEVTISYLGAALTTPLEQRRTLLQEQYGFACACVRCRAEQQVAGQPLQQIITSTHQRCQDVSPVLEACIESGDLVGVKRCQTDLLGLRTAFEKALREAKVSLRLSAKACRWLQCSVYDLYDVLSLAADELAGTELAPRSTNAARATGVSALVDTESLAVCARLLEALAPGSDSHCALAAELAERTVTRFNEEHEEARQARVMCDAAFRTRYGPVSTALLRQLIAARLMAEEQ